MQSIKYHIYLTRPKVNINDNHIKNNKKLLVIPLRPDQYLLTLSINFQIIDLIFQVHLKGFVYLNMDL